MSSPSPAGGDHHRYEPAPGLLIVDDERLFAEALRHALIQAGISIVEVATTAAGGLSAIRSGHPGVVIVSARLLEDLGTEIARCIDDEVPEMRVIVLADGADPDPANGHRYHGLVSMDVPASSLVGVIEEVRLGREVRAPRTTASSVPAPARAVTIPSLTARELEVIHLLVAGSTSEQIAERLGVKADTARKHVQNVLTKLQAHSRLEAVTVAVRRGIVRLSDVDGMRRPPSERVSAGSPTRLPPMT